MSPAATQGRVTNLEHGADGRVISVEHIDGAGHIVHGVHGFVLINAEIHAHVTFTWAAARPYTVVVTCTNPADGTSTHLYIGRDLLKHGGKPRNIKVDFAGTLAFIEVNGIARASGEPSSRWMSLNRQWLANFIAATEAIRPAEPATPTSGT